LIWPITQPSEQSAMVFGVDFSSAPSSKKPITAAVGQLVTTQHQAAIYKMQRVIPLHSFSEFHDFLHQPGPWLAGFDLPFSLPRPLIEHYGWPSEWPEFIDWYGNQSRESLRQAFKEFCNARPVGQKYVYRKTDRPAGSSPAMRWTNPPVAWMLHAGAPMLKAAGLFLPGLYKRAAGAVGAAGAAGAQRVGLEAYPGFTARKVTRASYKSDDKTKHTAERQAARQEILAALCQGTAGLSVRLQITPHWKAKLVGDGSGDLMDAAICALQAAHAALLPNFGFPQDLDTLEGWIASVPHTTS
jgi:hypothetical protein